jgi:hypothetical protein
MSVSDIERDEEHSMSKVYHTGVTLTGGRPGIRPPNAWRCDDLIDAGLHITVTSLLVMEGC